MEQLVKNKAYELGERILVFRNMKRNDESVAEFLEYTKTEDGSYNNEAIIEISIPLERINLERDVLQISKEGRNCFARYNWKRGSSFTSEAEFQNLLNQYNNAIN